ncbi:FGGY-family carbohydrate kinase [Hasllibacter sp. MH4015]|uniref:FGGY-family carbohydrate kinase n=1 Tax=Hasllibacter sp. MH4015 TaxID=2854029 RepID=UPI001CD19D4B|nr:FGGY-family carbohydrate kinase [Hasllibacter sp. MH4015]
MRGLSLGLDLGTSGIRSAVIDASGAVLSMARGEYGPTDPDRIDATAWWRGVEACLTAQMVALRREGFDPADISRIGVDGTSGSMVVTDADLRPVTRALMYNSGGFLPEAERVAALAPDPHITRGPNSALTRALRLLAEDRGGNAAHLLHQADYITAKLSGQGGYSDHNNALKTGFDPATGAWPDWFGALGLPMEVLPKVLPAGAPVAPLAPNIAARFGLSPQATVHVGTTDSIAAFLAAAPMQIGAAVTSLGTTLAVKILSPQRIDAPDIGLYAHRLGDGWLVGGASNSGGGVLRQFFNDEEIAALSGQIDPARPSELDYYPLPAPGERFPINDPHLAPRLEPRPENDAAFLHGLLEGIARIEARCYGEMTARGAGVPEPLFTAGGGAQNPVWTAIRARVLGRDIFQAEHTEAAIGTARLISRVDAG